MPFRFGKDIAGGGLAVTGYIEKPRETEVILPDGTDAVGSGAFRGCGSVERVVLPSSVKRIMNGAFAGCTRLRGIELCSVREIDREAFAGCISLRKIYLPDTVSVVREGVFRGCTALSELRLPARMIEDMSGLAGCGTLSSLVIGDRRFTVSGADITKNGASIPEFMYKCLENKGYLLRKYYGGYEIPEGFLYGFAFEMYGYGLSDAAEFIDTRYDAMLRGGVRNGHIGIVKLLLGMRGGETVTDELVDLAANVGSHEIYLMLIASRHGGGSRNSGRFGL